MRLRASTHATAMAGTALTMVATAATFTLSQMISRSASARPSLPAVALAKAGESLRDENLLRLARLQVLENSCGGRRGRQDERGGIDDWRMRRLGEDIHDLHARID